MQDPSSLFVTTSVFPNMNLAPVWGAAFQAKVEHNSTSTASEKEPGRTPPGSEE